LPGAFVGVLIASGNPCFGAATATRVACTAHACPSPIQELIDLQAPVATRQDRALRLRRGRQGLLAER
jgi:hypothetical protein